MTTTTDTTPRLSARAQVLLAVPEKDRTWVSLEANRIMNMSPGYRPSDAARLAVREYESGRLTLESFNAARVNWVR